MDSERFIAEGMDASTDQVLIRVNSLGRATNLAEYKPVHAHNPIVTSATQARTIANLETEARHRRGKENHGGIVRKIESLVVNHGNPAIQNSMFSQTKTTVKPTNKSALVFQTGVREAIRQGAHKPEITHRRTGEFLLLRYSQFRLSEPDGRRRG